MVRYFFGNGHFCDDYYKICLLRNKVVLRIKITGHGHCEMHPFLGTTISGRLHSE